MGKILKQLNNHQEKVKDNEITNAIINYRFEEYQRKHDLSKSKLETKILNNCENIVCPYCRSNNVSKFGFTSNGVQRYLCKNCKKTFTRTRSTFLQNHKISIECLIDFLTCIMSQNSISSCARFCYIDNKTAYKIMKYIFVLLRNWQKQIVLKGDHVELNEIIYTLKYKVLGVSSTNIFTEKKEYNCCIGIAVDEQNIKVLFEGEDEPNNSICLKAFNQYIEANSTLYHVNNGSHDSLIDKLSLWPVAYKESQIANMTSNYNPMMKWIRIKDMLLHFLSNHKGIRKENLQDYLNLFCFIMCPPHNFLAKTSYLVEKLLDLSTLNSL